MLFALPLVLAAAAAPTPDAEIKAAAEAMRGSLVATRRDFHQNPELSNRETRTGQAVAERLRALGLEVRFPVAKTGVVGVLKGGRPGGVVALRADMDALPIQEKSDVPYKSKNAGVMHACGHDAHTAMLLGAAEVLAKLKARLPGTVVFLFQPAEEGAPAGEAGGAALMVKEGALDDPKVEAVFGLHVGAWTDVGQIGFRPGPLLAAADTFSIEVQGRRSHGAQPWEGLDPIPVAAEMVQALQLVVSRQLDARNPKVLTIGQVHGGTRHNIIAEQVRLDGTLRTFDQTLRADVKQRMQRTVRGVAEAHGTTATLRFESDGGSPTVNDAALAQASRPALERVFGAQGVVDPGALMVAEDFPSYTERVPGLFLMLGTRSPAKGLVSVNHSDTFDIDEDALPLGVRALATLAWDFLGRPRGAEKR